MYKKSAQQFVYFVETLVASETYSEFGRRLLVEGETIDMEGSKELNDEQYGKLYTHTLHTCTSISSYTQSKEHKHNFSSSDCMYTTA